MGIIKLNKMIGKISALCALTATVCAAPSDHWAIIVAGSSGFGNYRHQADTCHAYQIVKDSGIPEEQIIMFNYDDAANSSYQHADFKGKLFNKPTAAGVQGVDVYEGCNIDFKGKHATAKNLLSVMKGDPLEDSTASKKTLKSNSNSKIFFYFADHGAPGLVPCQLENISTPMNFSPPSSKCTQTTCTRRWLCTWKPARVDLCSRNSITNHLTCMLLPPPTVKSHLGELTALHTTRSTVNLLDPALEISTQSTGWRTLINTARHSMRLSRLNTRPSRRRPPNPQFKNSVTSTFKKNQLVLSNQLNLELSPKTRNSGDSSKAEPNPLLRISSTLMRRWPTSKTSLLLTPETSTSITSTPKLCSTLPQRPPINLPPHLTKEWSSIRDSPACSQSTWKLSTRTRLQSQPITLATDPSSIPTRTPAVNSMTTP